MLVVEDRLAYSKTVFHAVKDATDHRQPPRTARAVDLVGHGELLANPSVLTRRQVDVVLLDAFETDRQRDEPQAPLYAAIDVLDLIERERRDVRVVLYSQAIDDPAVHLIAREYPMITTLIAPDHLLYNMASVLWDDHPDGALGPATDADFAALGIGSGARLRNALNAARSRDDVWQVVVEGANSSATHPRVRDFLNSSVRPHLDMPTPGYKAVVDVLQRIIGPPAKSAAIR